MTIKTKLVSIAVMTLLAFVCIGLAGIIGKNIQSRYEQADELAMSAMNDLLEARRAEKNYLLRLNDQNSEQVSQYSRKIAVNLEKFEELDETMAEKAAEGIVLIREYDESFQNVVRVLRTLGYDANSGIRGKLTETGHAMTAAVRKQNNPELDNDLFNLRENVRIYLQTHKSAYKQKFHNDYETFRSALQYSGNADSTEILTLLDTYNAHFNQFTAKSEERTHLEGIFTELGRKVDPLFKKLEEHAEHSAETVSSRVSTITLLIEITTVAILLVMILLTTRSILRSLGKLQGYVRQVADGNFSEIDTEGITGELLALHADIRTMVLELKNKLGFAQGVLKAIPIPCLVSDRDDVITYANDQIVDYVGRQGAPESFLGWKQSRFVFDNDAQTLSEQAMANLENIDVDYEFGNLAGRHIVSKITATPIHDLDDELIGAILLCVDQTDLAERQKLIQAKNEAIEKAAAEAENISAEVASSAEELSAQIEQSSHGAELQRQRTAEVATAVEEMNATVLEVARNASNAAEQAERAQKVAGDGANVVGDVVTSINMIHKSANERKDNLDVLGNQVEGIGQIVDVISDIADQTNLLALNAAIEAARAGESGRGFAVVADEVRKLAEKTMAATREVGTSIRTIQDGTRKSIEGMNQAAEAVQKTAHLAEQAGDSLNEIVGIVQQTSDQIRDIATASEEQSATSEQIARSTEEINLTSVETSEAMNQSADAVGTVAHLASDLRGVIEQMQQ